MDFQSELDRRTREAEECIEAYLPLEEGFARTAAQAVNYSMKAGGKRLRPVLMAETYRIFGGSEEVIRPFMAAMEMIHTHSLIHDDLPALDNDDYRRGKLTTHKVFGEAMGVLSGDVLLNLAYETMLKGFSLTERTDSVVRAMKVMAEKTGLNGMLGGQTVDVENEGKPIDRNTLDFIYEKKTSALLEASMMTGAILAGADDREIDTICRAGRCVGLAFQIRDDILDVAGDEKSLGKPLHSDEKNHKVTYVSLLGKEAAEEKTEALSREAVEVLLGLHRDSAFLCSLVLSLSGRSR